MSALAINQAFKAILCQFLSLLVRNYKAVEYSHVKINEIVIDYMEKKHYT